MTVQEEVVDSAPVQVGPTTLFRSSPQVGDLISALAKAQGEIECATKDAENPHFQSRYANLASVWRAIRAPLSKNGLAVVQPYVDGHLITRLCHGEQWIESDVRVLIEQNKGLPAVQALGSALTYLRRYCLSTLVGVAPDDDEDGEGAGGVQVPQAPEPRRAPQQERREPPKAASAPPTTPDDDETRAVMLLRGARDLAMLGAASVEISKRNLTPELRQRCLGIYREQKERLTSCLSA